MAIVLCTDASVRARPLQYARSRLLAICGSASRMSFSSAANGHSSSRCCAHGGRQVVGDEGGLCVSVSLSVSLCLSLSVSLSVCLSLSVSLSLSLSLSYRWVASFKNARLGFPFTSPCTSTSHQQQTPTKESEQSAREQQAQPSFHSHAQAFGPLPTTTLLM